MHAVSAGSGERCVRRVPVTVALVAAIGCGPVPRTGPHDAPGAPPEESLRMALSDDFAARFAARAVVERYGRGRLSPGGVPLDGPRLPRAPAEYVVQEARSSPRIIVEEQGVRFLLHVDPGDLRTAPVREAVLAPAAPDAGAAGDGAVTVFPGALVHVVSREIARVEVAIEDDAFQARGWLPANALGVVYVPVMGIDAGAPRTVVRAGAVLAEHPGGTAIGRFVRAVSVEQRATRAGFVQIRHDGAERQRGGALSYRALGWIAGSDVAAEADAELVAGVDLERHGSPHRVRLRPGQYVHSEIGGPVVGVTLPGAEAIRGATQGRWLQLSFETAWGELTVWGPRTVLEDRRSRSD